MDAPKTKREKGYLDFVKTRFDFISCGTKLFGSQLAHLIFPDETSLDVMHVCFTQLSGAPMA